MSKLSRILLLPFAEAVEALLQRTSNLIDSFELPLIDSYTLKRQTVPCRGLNCKHNDTFDLQTFVAHNSRNIDTRCPVCDHMTPVCDLRQDALVLRLLGAIQNDAIQLRPKEQTYACSSATASTTLNVSTNSDVIEVFDSDDESDDDVCIISVAAHCLPNDLVYSQLSSLPAVPVLE